LLPVAIAVAGIIALLQLVMSIWSLVASWDNSLAYAIESKSDNYRSANQFAELGKTTSLSEAKFESELSILETIADLRSSLDNRVDISDKEKRMGMRAGLRNYQRKCAGCCKIPSSMKPTKCGVCGNL
jgi:mobilome CxxCx(11)CxxC protein